MRWLLALGLVLCACPKGESAEDRTLARLKAEQERLAHGGSPASAPVRAEDPLTRATTNPLPPRALTVAPSAGRLGDVEFSVKSAELSQTVRNSKLELTTQDQFVKIVLEARAVGPGATYTLAQAQLSRGELKADVARDAQKVGEGSPLSPTRLEEGIPADLVVYFEAVPGLIGPGLTLGLPSADGRLELVIQ